MISTETLSGLHDDTTSINVLAQEIEQASDRALSRLNANPEDIERGLSRLVLAVIELLRQLLERQAIRRIDAGSLTDVEIERLGDTFLRLEQQMIILKQTFGLTDDDLNIDLGPLGKLL
jgi:Gas vesicle protein K